MSKTTGSTRLEGIPSQFVPSYKMSMDVCSLSIHLCQLLLDFINKRFGFLQNPQVILPEPIILHEQPSLGRTVLEKFEDVARQIDLVFVLLTPDDSVHKPESPNDLRRRARQNVIFEMGYFFSKLQRKKGKVIHLYKGELELPSDISGIIYIDISKGIEAAGEQICKELSTILSL